MMPFLFADECHSVLNVWRRDSSQVHRTCSVVGWGENRGLSSATMHIEPGDVFVKSSVMDEFPQSSPFIMTSLSDEDIEIFLFKTHSEYGRSSLSSCYFKASLFSVRGPQILNNIASLDGSDQSVKEWGSV